MDQPTVEKSISILRGIKGKYELHHGVKISDNALVEAAVLSDRYNIIVYFVMFNITIPMKIAMYLNFFGWIDYFRLKIYL